MQGADGAVFCRYHADVGSRERSAAAHDRGCREHRLQDGFIRAAAAEHILKRGLQFSVIRVRVFQEIGVGIQNLRWRTKAALYRAVAREGCLQRMRAARGGGERPQPLNRENGLARGFSGGVEAGLDWFIIHQNCANAAAPFATANFGAGQAQTVAQQGGKRFAGNFREGVRAAIDI